MLCQCVHYIVHFFPLTLLSLSIPIYTYTCFLFLHHISPKFRKFKHPRRFFQLWGIPQFLEWLQEGRWCFKPLQFGSFPTFSQYQTTLNHTQSMDFGTKSMYFFHFSSKFWPFSSFKPMVKSWSTSHLFALEVPPLANQASSSSGFQVQASPWRSWGVETFLRSPNRIGHDIVDEVHTSIHTNYI